MKKKENWRQEAFAQGFAELDEIAKKHPDVEHYVSAALIMFGMILVLPENATQTVRDDYLAAILRK